MRSAGVRGVLVYCGDYKCAHSIAMNADQWPNDMRLSDLEPQFAAGRPLADPEKAARKLVEIANAVEPYMDQRVLIELINGPFLKAGGTRPNTGRVLISPSPRTGCGVMNPAPT